MWDRRWRAGTVACPGEAPNWSTRIGKGGIKPWKGVPRGIDGLSKLMIRAERWMDQCGKPEVGPGDSSTPHVICDKPTVVELFLERKPESRANHRDTVVHSTNLYACNRLTGIVGIHRTISTGQLSYVIPTDVH